MTATGWLLKRNLSAHYSGMDAAAQIREALCGIEIPIVIGEQHAVVVQHGIGKACRDPLRALGLPPAMGHASRARRLRIIDVHREPNGSVGGLDPHSVVFRNPLAPCVSGVDENVRLGLEAPE